MRLIASLLVLWTASAIAQSQPGSSLANSVAGTDVEAPAWRLAPVALTTKCDAVLARVRQQIKSAVLRPIGQRTFDNSLKVIENETTNFWEEVIPLTFLYQVSPDSSVRAASASCDQKVQAFNVDVTADPNIYATALALSKSPAITVAEDKKLIAFYLEFGRHVGADLDSSTRQQVTQLFVRLSDVQRDFTIALGADTTTITASAAEIVGIPAQFVTTFKRAPAGDYIIPVSEATYFTVMPNAVNAGLRERYFRADSRRGGTANVDRLIRALSIRDSIAHLMGVPNWASYQLQLKMGDRSSSACTT
jgi:thimet oligopeptidase